jgi:cell division protein FtsB
VNELRNQKLKELQQKMESLAKEELQLDSEISDLKDRRTTCRDWQYLTSCQIADIEDEIGADK